MYRDGTKLQAVTLVVNNNYGGLGDMIARMPAFLYTLTNHPHVSFDIYVYDFAVELHKAAFKDFKDRLRVLPRSELEARKEEIYASGRPIIDFAPTQFSSSKNHLTEYAFGIIENRIPARGPDWDYLQPDLTEVDMSGYNLPVRYGVLTTGFTAPVREWLPEHVLEVADWMVHNKITPVYLGKKETNFGLPAEHSKAELNDSAIHPHGLDLRGKTDLLQALKILSNAQFVAGVDNGLLHLASMSDVPVIWGFSSVLPHTRLPFRHGQQGWRALSISPKASLHCRFCQTRQNYVPCNRPNTKSAGHDYKYCLYDDYHCLTHLTAGRFISRIKQVIGHKGLGARMGRGEN